MTFLNEFYSPISNSELSISAEQGSRFAKQVADDFNPIHHPDSRRFCVPGDLLFSIALSKYGICKSMNFRFLDLLNADMPVCYPPRAFQNDEEIVVKNGNGKPTLGIKLSGAYTQETTQIESLIRSYVAFSGHNFPDILAPLMSEHDVMINPLRPLVIYESMSLEFTDIEFKSIAVELSSTSLEVVGKRGEAKLNFALMRNGQDQIGIGVKKLILSGLRPYEEDAIQSMRDEYSQSKELYGV